MTVGDNVFVNCTLCNGEGFIFVDDGDGRYHAEPCPVCSGKGKVRSTVPQIS